MYNGSIMLIRRTVIQYYNRQTWRIQQDGIKKCTGIYVRGTPENLVDLFWFLCSHLFYIDYHAVIYDNGLFGDECDKANWNAT